MSNWQQRIDVSGSGPDSDILRRIDSMVDAGQLPAAIDVARAAVQRGSKQMAVHLRLANALLKAGEYREAERVVDGAARSLVPGGPQELIDVVRRLAFFNRSATVRGLAIRLLAAPAWDAQAEADFAAMLSMMGEQPLAFSLLRRAMKKLGDSPGPLYNRSQMHLYAGRMKEAEDDLRHCLYKDPRNAKAHWALSKISSRDAIGAELYAYSHLAATYEPGSRDEAFIRFAMFNYLDRLDRPDDAWMELGSACRVKRGLLNYDPAASRALFEALRSFDPGVPPAARATPGAPVPIFIVGMHRSGTTLLERVLGNHSQVAAGGELYDFPAQLRWVLGRHFPGPSDAEVVAKAKEIDFGLLGIRYLDQVSWRADGKPYLVDKLPSNFLNVGFIRRALPQAKILHITRDPMDTCFSNLKELFSAACPYSYDQKELADWYLQYRGLMEHWKQVAPDFVFDVSYEKLAADPEGEARRILAFCGLEFEPGCLDVASNRGSVNTASSAQVREPIHQRNVGAWRRYEKHLGPLAEALRPVL
jgi:tetratricopeptide (TPR) repeat protein